MMSEKEKFLKIIKKNNTRLDLGKIKKAFDFAAKYHGQQKRASGEPFLKHPIFVALYLSKLKLDTATICAALLHDLPEDTNVSLAKIQKNFGEEVAYLVNGVTKLKRLKFKSDLEDYSMENLRKMFVAMAKDIRVIIIKLIDRLHNMQTIKNLSASQQIKKAKETMEIYVPIANRLGMGELKGQLEDLSFPYIYPKEYKWVSNLIIKERLKKEKYIEKAKKILGKKLKKANIKYLDIHGRAKHLYSFYKKLLRYNKNINKIYDLVALRVIVPTVKDCYSALGVIHEDWKPLIGRIKDYISVPKANGYQSLHTTVLSPDGEIVEIQIRTMKMHKEAEFGIAAHWHYLDKDKIKTKILKSVPKKLSWVTELAAWQKEFSDNKKFAESLKIDLFKDRIFVFTPHADVLDLPQGATPVDFAYHIHTDLGCHCIGAKINEKIAPLDTKLKNGDVVEILTSKKSSPKYDWLNFVKTNAARSKIRKWLLDHTDLKKRIEYGKQILNKSLQQLKQKPIDQISQDKIKKILKTFSYKNLDELFTAIAQGEIKISTLIKNLFSPQELLTPNIKKHIIFGKRLLQPRAVIKGEAGFLSKIAKCCRPSYKDKIKAYVTRSQDATIHKIDCPQIKKQKGGKIFEASWVKTTPLASKAEIEIVSFDRIGLLKDMTSVFSNLKINILDYFIKRKKKSDIIHNHFIIEIKDIELLTLAIQKLEKVKGVLEVKTI